MCALGSVGTVFSQRNEIVNSWFSQVYSMSTVRFHTTPLVYDAHTVRPCKIKRATIKIWSIYTPQLSPMYIQIAYLLTHTAMYTKIRMSYIVNGHIECP